jgi:hypothetical protein
MLNATYWVVVVLLLISIVELLRRKVLREKYAVVWLAIATLLILGAIFPEKVNYLSYRLGFQYLSNFVLFIFMIINLFISMQLSLSVGKAENQVQSLAEEVAILRSKLEQ